MFLHITYQTSQRHWWLVALAHEKMLHDYLVELGIGMTGQETVQFDKEPQVDFIGLWLQSHFWDFEESEVIGDGANNDSNFVFTSLLLHITYQPSQRHWWPVALAHEKTLHDDLVELGIGTTGQETVQLDEEPQVDIIGLRGSPVDFTVFLMRNIHTLEIRRQMFLLLLTKILPA